MKRDGEWKKITQSLISQLSCKSDKVWLLDGSENWQYPDIFVFDHWFEFNLGW